MKKLPFQQFVDGTHANSRLAIDAPLAEIGLIQSISDLYAEFLALPALENAGPRLFIAMSHASFLSAAQLSTSGQLPASYMASRGVLEAAIYGFHVVNKPELKEVWSSRHEGEEEKRKVKNSFKIGDLKAELAAVNEALANQFALAYDATIDLGAHPNSLSFWTNLTPPDPDGSQVWLYLNTEGHPYRWAIQTAAYSGVTALMVLGVAFAEHMGGSELIEGMVRELKQLTKLQAQLGDA